MGAAALPVASIGVSGLKSVLTSVQDSQKIVEETEGLEDRSRIASEQARYQQTMAEREAAEIARQAGEDAEDAEKEYRRLRASQVAQMGASGFSGGSPVSSLSDSVLDEDLEDIEAQANYDVGTSLLTGYNAVRQYLQQAEDYQEQADDLQTAYGQTSLTGNKSLLGQLLASANYLSS
jgi:hypothetical protein